MTTSNIKVQSGPKHAEAREMFNRVARRYDLLNHLLSLGSDIGWRKTAASLLPEREGARLLDIAAGTGDYLISFCRRHREIELAVGLDLSEEMLAIARQKIVGRKLQDRVFLIQGDALRLPFSENSFDTVTVAFGVRNFPDVPRSLAEMHRVLKPAGEALILELSLPQNKLFNELYLFYFRYILPVLGGLVSGQYRDYRYLNESVESFPCGEAFVSLLTAAGFKDATAMPLTFGVANIYKGAKGNEPNSLT